ncbi:hypothetical protein ISN44_As11g006350 [Arabidopsis suecica]|uniref:Uncharacterized protein n=1 Tax=Arabidopsis suecica TaxID=45249 RepID=A0A8T1Z631_ARASU|nr:hypothetical protein ISN44_As11g006350 [Arabidopsis suecica]
MLVLIEPERIRECRFRSITSLVGERVLHLTSCHMQQSEFGLHVSKPSKPRSFMAMARDGLLPAFFSEISPRTQVPVKSTIAIGVLAVALAFSWMLHSCPRWLV